MPDLDPDLLRTLKGLIATDAPQLAALLDGANAAVAVRALGKALLGDAEAPLADVVGAARSADKLKIAAAEQEAQLRLRQSGGGSLAELGAALAAANTAAQQGYQDTADARRRQIATHDQTNQILAYVVTGIFFVLILALIFAQKMGLNFPDNGVKDLLYTLLGVVATGWANIIGFYFGSSAGSAQKSQAINDALVRATAAAGS
jgi:hypothetical protein